MKNNRKDARYFSGDVLSFRIRGEDRKIMDQIKGFEDSLIVFQNYKINVNEITALYLDRKTRLWYFLKYKYEYVLPMLGGGYLLLDVLNSGELSRETAVIGASFIGAGLIARLLISKKLRIRGKRKLRIVNI
jgi:hypothetical protein